MELSTITSSDYNSISPLGDDVSFTFDDVLGLGSVITKHGMQDLFSVGLLHRHFNLREQQVMCHSRLDADVDLCRPVMRSSVDRLWPYSFMIDSKNQFQSFEYSDSSMRPLTLLRDGPFLDELRQNVQARNLTAGFALISLTHLPDHDTIGYENTVPQEKMLRTQRVKQPPGTCVDRVSPDDTAWRFSTGEAGAVKVICIKKCVKYDNGAHKRVQDA
ncbi:hypothetical protein BDZ85DRAFT_267325 [Elsinoe ampelina]|uniref:Uncharacterized protein n=1 Tax=Elsinoe ampelina TaxID=302913 RepID=A0A6A6G3G6_9PEZI|nr:hypothetical protein BDZ85DRAFT_267325 [Elsinoe ampelina]